MKSVSPKVKEQLWAKMGPELERGVKLFVENGAKVKGMKPKQALAHVLIEVVKLAYMSGLDRGYDMGSEVFGDSSGLSEEGVTEED